MQLRELDWAASRWKPRLASRWRPLVCQLLASIPAVATWNAYFPHTFWFEKFCAGLATGALLGLFPGVYWLLREPNRRSQTSGWFLVFNFAASVVFTGFAVFLMAPDLEAQERELAAIRSLSAAEISELRVRIGKQLERRIVDAATISSLTALTQHAELFYPNHEGSALEFQLVIQCQNETAIEFGGRVPKRHLNDISLEFRGYFTRREILIRDGRDWLDGAFRVRAR